MRSFCHGRGGPQKTFKKTACLGGRSSLTTLSLFLGQVKCEKGTTIASALRSPMGAINQTEHRLAFWRGINRTGDAGKTRVHVINVFGGDAVHLQDHVENFNLDQLRSAAVLAELVGKLDIKGKQRMVAIARHGVHLGRIEAGNAFRAARVRVRPLIERISSGIVHWYEAFLFGGGQTGRVTSR